MQSDRTQYRLRDLFVVFLGVFLLFQYGNDASAQVKSVAAPTVHQQLGDLTKSIDSSIETEKENLEKLSTELAQLKTLDRSISMEVNVYNVQQATFSSMLFLPQVQPRILENAFNVLQVSYSIIANQLEKLKSRNEYLTKANATSNELLAILTKQHNDVLSIPGNRTASNELRRKINTLRNQITQKQRVYFKLQSFYSERIDQLEKVQKAFSGLSEEYKKTLLQQSRRSLLFREISPFSSQWPSYLIKMAVDFGRKAEKMANVTYWQNRTDMLRKSDLYDIVSFLLLLGVSFYIGIKIRFYIRSFDLKPLYNKNPSIQLPLELLEKSVTLLLILLFLFSYQQIVSFSGISTLSRPVLDLLLVWIMTGWGLGFLIYKSMHDVSEDPLKKHLAFLFRFIRWFGLVFVVLSWLFEYDKIVLMAGRLILELSLIGISLSLWSAARTWKRNRSENKTIRFNTPFIWSTVIVFVAFGGLIAELIGFSSFALFWYLSWGKTAILLLWSGLLARVLKEEDEKVKQLDAGEDEIFSMATYHARWIGIRLMQLGGPLVFALLLVLSWGGQRTIQSNAYSFLSHKFHIGDMSFSLLSFLQAVLVLMVTHVTTRLWRHFFQKRFLNRSRMEPGLQDSITALTIYLIWIFGIIIALNAFGLNPTSLVVVFGALGIGLGFGLQNIFNNFMSGLILLFERPIQVGDEIEINGLWSTVKKINVRSTLVQTIDNASLIIPNSDLINNQVTNWSFKDKRLRRKITVGVAYGSDIELVRQTLLDISRETRNVLRYPQPDVIFTDFGDSALIFKLRFWTHIENMWEAETALRFEINRQFKEKNITIAFPQQDVHFYPAKVSDQNDS